jgi:hypothetical protein
LSHSGRSLLNDFRRIPRLTAGFLFAPILLLSTLSARLARTVESEAVL